MLIIHSMYVLVILYLSMYFNIYVFKFIKYKKKKKRRTIVSHVQTLTCQNFTVLIKVLDLYISTTRQQIYTHIYI